MIDLEPVDRAILEGVPGPSDTAHTAFSLIVAAYLMHAWAHGRMRKIPGEKQRTWEP